MPQACALLADFLWWTSCLHAIRYVVGGVVWWWFFAVCGGVGNAIDYIHEQHTIKSNVVSCNHHGELQQRGGWRNNNHIISHPTPPSQTSRAAKLFEQRLQKQRQQHDATMQLHKALQVCLVCVSHQQTPNIHRPTSKEDTRIAMFHKWETATPTITKPSSTPPQPTSPPPPQSPQPHQIRHHQPPAERRALLTEKALVLAHATERARQQRAHALHQQRLRNECDALRSHLSRQHHQALAVEWRHRSTTASQRKAQAQQELQQQQRESLEIATKQLDARHAADVARANAMRTATLEALQQQLQALEQRRAAEQAAADAESAALRAMWQREEAAMVADQQRHVMEKRAQAIQLAEACRQQQAARAARAREEAWCDDALVRAAQEQESLMEVIDQRIKRLRADEMKEYRYRLFGGDVVV